MNAREALQRLTDALRERHYGRMPDEVQAAYDAARAVLAQPPASDDLTARLRAHNEVGDEMTDLENEAADALDALRAEVEIHQSYMAAVTAALAKADPDNTMTADQCIYALVSARERLRAALQRAYQPHHVTCKARLHGHPCTCGLDAALGDQR